MKVLDPGHFYECAQLDNGPFDLPNFLRFVKRIGGDYPGNTNHYAGTTLQEVLRACIDRVKYLNQQLPDHRNEMVLINLRRAIYALEIRAAERHHRIFPLVKLHEIELALTCPKCLHIGCEGECHA